jgi:hypothetical protein
VACKSIRTKTILALTFVLAFFESFQNWFQFFLTLEFFKEFQNFKILSMSYTKLAQMRQNFSFLALNTAELAAPQISSKNLRQRRVTDVIFFALNLFLLFSYEIWKVLVSLANKKKNILLIIPFYDILYQKNVFRPKKIFPSVTRRRCCWRFLDKICSAASSAVLNARKLQFWLQASFDPT